MIDVDIVGQLIPNPITMFTQLCSTLVLFLLMRKFLWKSVKEFLAARGAKMQEDLTAGEQARLAAETDRAEAAAQLKNAGSKSEEIVAAAVKEAASRKEEILADAAHEAEQVKSKAREQMAAEREAMYSDMQKEMVEVAMAAAGKLLAKESGEDLDRQAIDAFVKEATDGEGGCRPLCRSAVSAVKRTGSDGRTKGRSFGTAGCTEEQPGASGVFPCRSRNG